MMILGPAEGGTTCGSVSRRESGGCGADSAAAVRQDGPALPVPGPSCGPATPAPCCEPLPSCCRPASLDAVPLLACTAIFGQSEYSHPRWVHAGAGVQ